MITEESFILNGKPLPEEERVKFEWRWTDDDPPKIMLWHIAEGVSYLDIDSVTLDPGETPQQAIDSIRIKIAHMPNGPGH